MGKYPRKIESYFFPLTQNLTSQKVTSTRLRILIPVKRPRIPPGKVEKIMTSVDYIMVSWTFAQANIMKPSSLPNAESLSKKLSLLVLTMTETVSVASLKLTSAL